MKVDATGHMVSRALMCVAITAIAWSAAAQDAPVRLTLDEAVARGLTNSQRLAELLARQDGAEAAVAGRAAATLPAIALQAGYMRTNHVEPFSITQPLQGVKVIYPDVPDNFRTRIDLQWAILYRRPHRRAGTRRARGARRRGRRSGGCARRPPSGDRARLLGARHGPVHRAGRRAFARQPRRARARPAKPARTGAHSAQ